MMIYNVLQPLSYTISNFYANTYLFVDAVLVFIIFLSLSKFVFTKKYEREGRYIAVAVSLALAFAFALFEIRTGFMLGGHEMQIISALILLAVLSFLLYELLHAMGMGMGCAAALTYFIMHALFMGMYSPLYNQVRNASDPLWGLLGIFWFMSFIALIMCVIRFFRELGGGGHGDHGGEHGEGGGGQGGGGRGGGGGGHDPHEPHPPVAVQINSPPEHAHIPAGTVIPFQANITGGTGRYVWHVHVEGQGHQTIRPNHQGHDPNVQLQLVGLPPGTHQATITVHDANHQGPRGWRRLWGIRRFYQDHGVSATVQFFVDAHGTGITVQLTRPTNGQERVRALNDPTPMPVTAQVQGPNQSYDVLYGLYSGDDLYAFLGRHDNAANGQVSVPDPNNQAGISIVHQTDIGNQPLVAGRYFLHVFAYPHGTAPQAPPTPYHVGDVGPENPVTGATPAVDSITNILLQGPATATVRPTIIHPVPDQQVTATGPHAQFQLEGELISNNLGGNAVHDCYWLLYTNAGNLITPLHVETNVAVGPTNSHTIDMSRLRAQNGARINQPGRYIVFLEAVPAGSHYDLASKRMLPNVGAVVTQTIELLAGTQTTGSIHGIGVASNGQPIKGAQYQLLNAAGNPVHVPGTNNNYVVPGRVGMNGIEEFEFVNLPLNQQYVVRGIIDPGSTNAMQGLQVVPGGFVPQGAHAVVSPIPLSGATPSVNITIHFPFVEITEPVDPVTRIEEGAAVGMDVEAVLNGPKADYDYHWMLYTVRNNALVPVAQPFHSGQAARGATIHPGRPHINMSALLAPLGRGNHALVVVLTERGQALVAPRRIDPQAHAAHLAFRLFEVVEAPYSARIIEPQPRTQVTHGSRVQTKLEAEMFGNGNFDYAWFVYDATTKTSSGRLLLEHQTIRTTARTRAAQHDFTTLPPGSYELVFVMMPSNTMPQAIPYTSLNRLHGVDAVEFDVLPGASPLSVNITNPPNHP